MIDRRDLLDLASIEFRIPESRLLLNQRSTAAQSRVDGQLTSVSSKLIQIFKPLFGIMAQTLRLNSFTITFEYRLDLTAPS